MEDEDESNLTLTYPGVSERVKSVITDSVIMIGFMIGATFIFSLFDEVPDNIRMYTFLFIFILYDPLFTSFFGATFGQNMNGINVKRESDESRNISFINALIRFVFKAALGWISLLTVSGNEKRKAIHDYVVGSVVLYNKEK